MHRLIIIAIFSVATRQAVSASLIPKDTPNAIPCTRVAPGFDKLLLGVDVTKLDLTPIASGHDQGYRNALFDLTCNQNKLWTDTLVNNNVYQLPDAVAMAFVDSHGYLDASSDYYQSYFDYRMQEARSWSVSHHHWFSSSTDSYTYRHMETIQQNYAQYFTRVHAEVSAQVGQLHPYWSLPLNDDVQSYIDNVMPEEYSTNSSAYTDFIAEYGTHYIDRGALGGIFSSTFYYDLFFKNQTDESFITHNSESSFFGFIHTSGGSTEGHDLSVNTLFSNHTNFTVTYYGGNPKLITDRNFTSWWDSVPQVPYVIGVKLEPLSSLLYKTPKKQNNLMLATVDYADRSYLRDMQRSLKVFGDKHGDQAAEAQKLLEQVEQFLAMMAPALLDHDQVNAVGAKVQTLLQTKW